MNNKFFFYALAVTLVVTFASWASMIGEASRAGGSNWSSSSGGGGRGGYGSGHSGGHK